MIGWPLASRYGARGRRSSVPLEATSRFVEAASTLIGGRTGWDVLAYIFSASMALLPHVLYTLTDGAKAAPQTVSRWTKRRKCSARPGRITTPWRSPAGPALSSGSLVVRCAGFPKKHEGRVMGRGLRAFDSGAIKTGSACPGPSSSFSCSTILRPCPPSASFAYRSVPWPERAPVGRA